MNAFKKEFPEKNVQSASPPKKPRVYKESEKVRHTTHWDIDYLPLKDVEALYAKGGTGPAPEKLRHTWLKREKLTHLFKRLPLWLVVLIVVLLFGRFVITLVFHFLSTST